ncbi:uncharacterized protein F5891DRAFT_1188630 [Suillus fuscotomentosus]|uniref:Chitin-binding type-3 domain-containing protein n=1 Tax=Suillus fuscotomentosus TaxID=1912939 RepID=A0AAD4HLY5_9AGAM|nr:uncharacterized protein F5891DRAFT_1188630 [Suillus fuscotomentosus]KAG1900314.1 hypothetical protein F5891DRAFT_1188630 [Suillus fuscotomentosus]
MFSKFISVAFILAATLAPSSAVVFPRDPQAGTLTPTITPTTMSTPTTTSLSSTTPTTSSKPVTPTTSTTPTSTPTTSITPPPSTTSSHPTTIVTPPATIPSSIPITPTTSSTPTTSVNPAAQPSKASSPSVLSVTCNGIQPWQVNLAYSAGAQVIFNNQLWTANQWSYNNNPQSAAAAWTLNGFCTQPISNKVDCTGIPGWVKSTAYNGGSKVTFNGQLWIATQWTESNSPGDASGTWKDLGVCN